MLAPVFIVMVVCARMLPSKLLLVPRVAELVTCQKTEAPGPVLIRLTMEPLDVISVLDIRKTHDALALPWPSSTKAPDKLVALAPTE